MTTPTDTDLAQALRELLECHKCGGFVQPDASLLESARAALAAHESSAQPEGHDDLVTRQSAINAIGLVAQFNGVGTEEEARRMLVEAQPASGHPEDSCERCGGKNIKPWFAPSPLWNKIADKDWSIICPQCFVELAREAGIDPTAWRLAPEDYEGPNDDPARTHGYTWVENGSLQLLEERARVMTSLRNEEVWYWQGDGFDFPESLSCPVVISADQLRKMLAAASAQPASASETGNPVSELNQSIAMPQAQPASVAGWGLVPEKMTTEIEDEMARVWNHGPHAVLAAVHRGARKALAAAPQPAKESDDV